MTRVRISRDHTTSSQCPRCGHVAAANGHATYGEWLDCREAFDLVPELAKWTKQWTEQATVTATSGGGPSS